ncbi:MAG: prepilin-type N-terminal cleavage/methylation domain-containing protein [Gammaproteobacteria bacterium]|nr:prepilin-type N-terminal cleavage/methylation domain-containing protein [Gammaproteobacteria bacterium]
MFTIHSIQALKRPGAEKQAGLTLIELMIAMVIGVFLLIGTLTVFTQSRANFRVSDSVARLQENARYALDAIEPGLRLARFWGRNAEPGSIPGPTDPSFPVGINVTCDTIDSSAGRIPPTTYTAWTLNLLQEIWAVDETSGYGHPTLGIPCSPATAAQPQSDALVVRHASGQPMPTIAGVIQVHTDHLAGELFNNGAVPVGYNLLAQTHNAVINVYYIDQSSDLDPNTPSLRIKTLVNGGIHEDQELISGVENLQVQFGVDTTNPNDGIVDRYVDADHNIINPTTPGTIANAKIMSIRLWMLMRADAQENGFQDRPTYTSPDLVINTCAQGAGCNYPDNFRRLAISKTIFLRNNR